MKKSASIWSITLGGLLVVNPAFAVKVTPLARVSALGGQYFTGETHSSGMNFDASIVPVITLQPKLHLIPIYIGSYHRTQSVYNFLGQNTLIQKQMDHTGVLRVAWSPSPYWRVKPRAGYKRQWIQQGTESSLASGLFNYGRSFSGVAVERVLPHGSVEMGYEYGQTRYPNYQALDADPRLTTTGITASAGSDVLDFNSHELTLAALAMTEDKHWGFNHTLTWLRENFLDQKVISQTAGGFESFVDKQRVDDILNLSMQQSFQPSEAWGFGMSETVQHYLSNQNAFDGTQIFANPFTYRYYNFFDLQLAPSITRRWAKDRWNLTLSGQFGYRKYSHRRTQDSSGTYENNLIYSANRGGTLTLRYRIVKGLYAMMTGSVLTYWSNTRFEANYPYNYTVASYLGGLTWEY